jgi:hypothetical protein
VRLAFLFDFVTESFFATMQQKRVIFLLPGGGFLLHSVKTDLTVQDDRSDGWRPGGWKIRSPGGRPAVSLQLRVRGLALTSRTEIWPARINRHCLNWFDLALEADMDVTPQTESGTHRLGWSKI